MYLCAKIWILSEFTRRFSFIIFFVYYLPLIILL